jgi:RNA polymerase sigma factor (sigma-70 family)
MAAGRLGKVFRQVEALRGAGEDGELLERFVLSRDEAAFETLLRRHGPMVLAVCRRVLRNEQDAEDAFQATFLVLLRRGASVRPRSMVGNFLYGVAYRTALAARRSALRRRAREAAALPRPAPQADPWEGVREALDREVARLPDRYRAPLVLCDLEGKTRSEAARQLGWPEGTVASRLARSRKILARRMARYGIVLSAPVWAAIVGAGMASAAVPPGLILSTARAVATGVLPAPVAALTQGVLRTMLLAKVKLAACLILAVSLAVAGLVVTANRSPAGSAEALPEQPGGEAIAAAPSADADEKATKDTRKTVTKEFDVSGFSSVEVSGAFHVEFQQADKFKTLVTTDEDVMHLVQVKKDGDKLDIRLDSEGRSINARTLKATISLPALTGVSLRGATHATAKGFKSSKDFKVVLAGASMLDGSVEAGKLSIQAEGASHIKLAGSAKEATLRAEGACHLQLSDFALDRADVVLRGASHAKVNARSQLDYTLSGASELRYRGKPTISREEVTGASSARPERE